MEPPVISIDHGSPKDQPQQQPQRRRLFSSSSKIPSFPSFRNHSSQSPISNSENNAQDTSGSSRSGSNKSNSLLFLSWKRSSRFFAFNDTFSTESASPTMSSISKEDEEATTATTTNLSLKGHHSFTSKHLSEIMTDENLPNSTQLLDNYNDHEHNKSDDIPQCRRSISFNDKNQIYLTDSDKKNQSSSSIKFIDDTNPIPSIKDKTNRTRAKTLNALENPLNDLTQNGGILSSLANFVKISRASSSTQLRPTPTKKDSSSSIHPKRKDTISLMEGETPTTYIDRLLEKYSITYITSILSQEDNDFHKDAFKEYLNRYFKFYDLPLDMALRKFLMINDLPKETQQIDRVVYHFSNHYCRQNPQICLSEDTVYILTFSLIMVHTDKFNPNNKKKMTRFSFVENVISAIDSNQKEFCDSPIISFILKEIAGYFYDNIVYCPFIKINKDQSDQCLAALKHPDLYQLPYPMNSFLNDSTSASLRSDSSSGQASISSQTYLTSGDYSSNFSTPLASPLPLTPSAISKNSSSQTITLRRRSSFLWSSTLIDPYDFLINERLYKLKVEIEGSEKNPFLNPWVQNLNQLKAYPYETDDDVSSIKLTPKIIHDNLTRYVSNDKNLSLVDEYDLFDDDGENPYLERLLKTLCEPQIELILKLPKSKASFLQTEKTELCPLNDPVLVKGEWSVCRVLKVGMLDRLERDISRKLSFSNISFSKDYIPEKETAQDKLNSNLANAVDGMKWKRYFAILTPVGLFLFRNVSAFKMHYAAQSDFLQTDTEFMTKKKTIIIEATSTGPLDSIVPQVIIPHGSFATRKRRNLDYDQLVNTKKNGKRVNSGFSILGSPTNFQNDATNEQPNNLRGYTFHIYGKNSNSVYMAGNIYELRSWIETINVLSALSDIKLRENSLDLSLFRNCKEVAPENVSNEGGVELGNVIGELKEDKYYEIKLIRNSDLEDRLHKKVEKLGWSYDENGKILIKFDAYKPLILHIGGLKLIKQLAPLNTKTKDMIISSRKLLVVRVEWMWYEKCRTMMIVDYLVKLRKKKGIFDYSDWATLSSQDKSQNNDGDETFLDAEDYYSCIDVSI
ncbi:Arf family guanine nucleotide exchange factor [Martiniozyma asiatica (nom. inval.)]|nr:Arf family guanine nucleotide exchange factor [Martiniozyma asiatica]